MARGGTGSTTSTMDTLCCRCVAGVLQVCCSVLRCVASVASVLQCVVCQSEFHGSVKLWDVATNSRLLKIIGLFGRILSLS